MTDSGPAVPITTSAPVVEPSTPSIMTVRVRDYTVRVHVEGRYTVEGPDGNILAAELEEQELRDRFPAAYEATRNVLDTDNRRGPRGGPTPGDDGPRDIQPEPRRR